MKLSILWNFQFYETFNFMKLSILWKLKVFCKFYQLWETRFSNSVKRLYLLLTRRLTNQIWIFYLKLENTNMRPEWANQKARLCHKIRRKMIILRIGFLKKFEGMFVFCIWDNLKNPKSRAKREMFWGFSNPKIQREVRGIFWDH